MQMNKVKVFWNLILNFFSGLKKTEAQVIAPVEKLPVSEDPAWLQVARKEIGVKEFVPGDNPRIVEYHKSTWLKASEDSVAWCAAFVSFCFESCGILSARSPRAKDYLTWGKKLDTPRVGCVCVFNRDGGGHVGFYLGEVEDKIKLLSGNSSNAVSIAYYSKVNLLGYRWPSGV